MSKALRVVLCVTAAWIPRGAAQVNVVTANYNYARTNANLNETALNTLNVNSTQFGKLFSVPVTGKINAQPLYVQNVTISGKAHNVVYVVTHHNDVYAFDADAQGDALWHVNLGPAVPGADYSVADLDEVGILSTPVIDPAGGTMYVVANTKESGNYFYRLHALDLSSGIEKLGGPTVIQATVPGAHFDAQNGQLSFNPSHHLQRAGLMLLNSVVYIGFGSHSDNELWHGWFLGYNAANIQQQVSAISAAPSGWGAAIWQGGRAPAVDGQGNIYWATGNGTFDGTSNFGESLVKLDTSTGIPKITDWFAPDNWISLNDLDNDLGSCGPVLTSFGGVIAGGKEGVIYLVDPKNMGHTQSGNGQILQHFQAIGFGIYNMAYWDRRGGPVLYLRANGDAVKAFKIVNNRFQTTPASQAGFTGGLPFDGMAVSANGSAAFSGILWVTMTKDPNQNSAGTLHALNASDLTQELWNSDANPSRDSLGTLAKFTAPTIANGKVYVPTFSGQLMVYGLLSQKPVLGAVVNSASGLGGAMAPGEIVTLYGSDMGPAQLAGGQVDTTGKLGRKISGTQVLFNGTAAPLLYARADQVAAIVPNAIAGQQTATVQVQYSGQSTMTVPVPVADTAPGLYTLDQSGRGPGAILNQDSSVNTAANPAAQGSVVVLYGTGQGLSDPDWAEDALASDPLPKPLKPVKVVIGGQPADILYAGAAPGMAGVIQINARVPSGIQTGKSVPVAVSIGTNSSQPGVTLAVR